AARGIDAGVAAPVTQQAIGARPPWCLTTPMGGAGGPGAILVRQSSRDCGIGRPRRARRNFGLGEQGRGGEPETPSAAPAALRATRDETDRWGIIFFGLYFERIFSGWKVGLMDRRRRAGFSGPQWKIRPV
ncbi:unnamed protein product, partial [Urochloa humidicola]